MSIKAGKNTKPGTLVEFSTPHKRLTTDLVEFVWPYQSRGAGETFVSGQVAMYMAYSPESATYVASDIVLINDKLCALSCGLLRILE